MLPPNEKIRRRTMSAFNTYKSIIERGIRLETPFEQGVSWYHEAHDYLLELSERSQFDVTTLAGATALLSPLTDWDRNLNGIRTIVQAYNDGLPRKWRYFLACRYTAYNNNARKCINLLEGDLSLDEMSGQKVVPFSYNLAGDLDAVTIDRHMWESVDRFGLQSSSPTGNAHTALVRAVKMCATMFNIQPAETQAVVWCTFRDTMK